MKIINKDLKRRIIEISYKKKLSHLGSCLTAVDIIKEIYDKKKPEEKFVLSAGHAGLALYVVNEAFGARDAEEVFDHHGVHPDRCDPCSISVSAGSLGHSGIAIGMALANRHKNVYILSSDGETNEGSWWEALRIAGELKLTNLKWFLNCNGWAAYEEMSSNDLKRRIKSFDFPVSIYKTDMEGYPEWLQGQQGHYVSMDKLKYEEVKSALE